MKLLVALLLTCCPAAFCLAQTTDTLLDVGGYRLHFQVLPGQGTPILFESGNGDDGSVWADLLQPLHDSTGATLITYDRAGLGSSEIDTTQISFEHEVQTLRLALDRLGVKQPVLLVSHSFGGFYATRFANLCPDRLAGVVLIDVATTCFFTPDWSRNFVATIRPEDWTLIQQYKPGLYYVLQHFEATARLMSGQNIPGSIPVTFISAEKPPSVVKPEELEHWRVCVQTTCQQPNYRLVEAKNCGHKVWADNPALVLGEIVGLYRRVAAGK